MVTAKPPETLFSTLVGLEWRKFAKITVSGIYPILFALSACNYERPTAIDIIGSKNEGSANITLEFNDGAQKAYLVYTTDAGTPNGAYVSLDNGIYQVRKLSTYHKPANPPKTHRKMNCPLQCFEINFKL